MSPEVAKIRADALAEAHANLNAPAGPRLRREDRPKTTAPSTKYVPPTNPNSIRQTVRTMLLAGSNTQAITAVLADKFPGTAAAEKPVIHIAYYRSQLRKAGLLAKKAPPVTN